VEPEANRKPLPYSDSRHQEAAQFLVEEAYLLDSHDYEAWLDLLTEDVDYCMPVRVTTPRGAPADLLETMDHFQEDLFSLQMRVRRFATEHAWTEDPPSRTRRFVTNLRTFAGEAPEELDVESYVLLFRSRGDVREPDLLSAERSDRLRRVDGQWRLAARIIRVDESVLRTQNLAVFL
jgi:phthalate 3,4-dioxygenase beta subunit